MPHSLEKSFLKYTDFINGRESDVVRTVPLEGEAGKLKLNDPTPVTDNLALAGIDEATRNNVANALTDLDYSVLRLKLKPNRDKTATLSTTIRGTATRGTASVPVDITLNFNGELEQLINTGLGYSNLLKGKQK